MYGQTVLIRRFSSIYDSDKVTPRSLTYNKCVILNVTSTRPTFHNKLKTFGLGSNTNSEAKHPLTKKEAHQAKAPDVKFSPWKRREKD